LPILLCNEGSKTAAITVFLGVMSQWKGKREDKDRTQGDVRSEHGSRRTAVQLNSAFIRGGRKGV